MIIRASIADMATVAGLHRAIRIATMPYLREPEPLDAVLRHFRETVFPASDIRLATDKDGLAIGYIAFRPGWVDHLYVAPGRQRRGIGTRLLGCSMQAQASVQLRVFQRNTGAIAFYTARGFTIAGRGDGLDNAEREPDLLMRWDSPR